VLHSLSVSLEPCPLNLLVGAMNLFIACMGRQTNDDDHDDVVRWCLPLMSSVKRVEEDLLLQLRDLEAPQVKSRFCLLSLFHYLLS